MLGNIYKTNFNEEKAAIVYKGESITFGQVDAMVNKYASYFDEIGIKKGDKVMLDCINCPEFVYAYLGVVMTGAIIIPVNAALTIDELTYIAANSEAKYMVIHPVILEKSGSDKAEMQDILGVELLVLDKEHKDIIDSKGAFTREVEIGKDDISTFLYTSGTTGKQKAAMLSHNNLIVNTEQCYNCLGLRSDDNMMCVLPMFHVFAFTVIILTSLWSGATVTILEAFQPKEVMNTLRNGDISIFMGVPAMYNVLLSILDPAEEFPKLRRTICGGASLPVEVYKRSTEIFCDDLLEGFGLTEASPGVSFNPYDGERKPGSIGLPAPGIECKIFDDDDNELPAGEVGEFVVRGENIMQGYYGNPEETEKALRNGWLHTGDLAKKDEDGYIYIVDRKKDMIIVSGVNVYPREVEEVIYTNPKVQEAAVVGAEDKLRGECVVAYVVLKEGEESTARDFLRYLKKHLAAYKVPRNVNFVDELPKNSSGKILKRLLRNTQ